MGSKENSTTTDYITAYLCEREYKMESRKQNREATGTPLNGWDRVRNLSRVYSWMSRKFANVPRRFFACRANCGRRRIPLREAAPRARALSNFAFANYD